MLKETEEQARHSMPAKGDPAQAGLEWLSVLVGFGAFVTFTIWVSEFMTGSLGVADIWALPLLSLAFVVTFLFLRIRPNRIDAIGYIPAVALNVYLIIGVYLNIFPQFGRMDFYQFYSTSYWFPIGTGVSFIFLAPRIAVMFSFSMLAIMLLPLAVSALSTDAYLWPVNSRLLVLQVVLAQIVFVILFLNVAVIRSRYSKTREYIRVLQLLSSTDSLTGLLNRRAMLEILRREIDAARHAKAPLIVAMIDVDYFKRINDGLGHEAGDVVLIHLGQLLTAQLRSQDHFGRWGGEEFLLIASETTLQNGHMLMEKLRETVAAEQFPSARRVTISAGIAELTDLDDATMLLKRADEALYRAKAEGRNRTMVAA